MYSNDEVLQYLISSGMVDLTTIQVQMEIMKRQEYLQMHSQKVWQGSNGYWYTYLGESKSRKMIKKKTKAEVEELIIKYYETSLKPTFEQMFEQWIDSKKAYGEIQQQTIDRYEYDYVRYLSKAEFAKKPIEELTEVDLEDYIKRTIHDQNLANHNWANMRIILNGTIKYAKKHGYSNISMRIFLDELDLSKKAFKKTSKKDEEQVFTKTEETNIKKFIRSKPTCMTSLGILFAFETGLRVGELSTLMPKDIEDNILNVSRTEVRYKVNGRYVKSVRESTKGRDGYRKVILTKEAIRILKEVRLMNPFGEYLFMQGDHRIPGNNYTMKLERICKQIGINPRSMHKIRKTYATNLLDNGVDEKLIEKQMGHTTIETTRKYYYFDNHTVEEAKEQIESALN